MEPDLVTPGDSTGRPLKRMRKGTHSCTECRRRKVRCKFLSEDSICVGCSERATECVSQGIPIVSRRSPARGVVQTPHSLIGSGTSDIVTSSGSNPPIMSALGRRMDSSPAPGRPDSLKICEVLRKRLPSYDTVIAALSTHGEWWESFRQKTRVVTQTEPVEQLQTFAAHAYTSSSAGKLGLLVVAYARSLGPGHEDHSLLSLIDQLVISDSSLVASLDGMECLVLLAKTYTDIGQPRRAWLTWRKGLAAAQLLGLHRAASLKDVRQRVWLAIYHGDRFTSLLLGLPHGFSDSHLFDTAPLSVASNTSSFEGWVTQFIHDCAVVAGQVIESILSPATPSFATAMQLDERLGKMYDSAPPGWWDIPAAEVWRRGGSEINPLVDKLLVHFFFFHVRLYTHLPFLKSSSPASSQVGSVSRVACRDAARNLLRRFLPLCIEISGVRVFDCKTSDFVGFTAAVALLLGGGDPTESSDKDKEDEQLLEQVRDFFQRQERHGCRIAAQCARALVCLSRSTWKETTGEVFIPYFGKVTPSRRTVSHGGERGTTPALSGSTSTGTTCVASGAQITPVNDLEYLYSGYPVQDAGMGSWEAQAGSFQGLDFMSLDIDQDWSLFLDSM